MERIATFPYRFIAYTNGIVITRLTFDESDLIVDIIVSDGVSSTQAVLMAITIAIVSISGGSTPLTASSW